ncbi:MAG: beta-ketoacyl-[acyl-carrier-protein] synthase family protein [Candidatus Rokubacteria bacterium]|nr:beta-ketoacyl-[acyl-carrier-protein] synthase family protein [Candidatus Rokubacteria bacterium]
MRRVAVTGVGIVSCLGNDKAEVWRALTAGASGVRVVPEMKELGYKHPVAGLVKGLATDGIGKKPLQTMSDPAKYAAVAALEALRDAGLPLEMLRSTRAGVVVGTGGGGVNDAAAAEATLLAHQSPARIGATAIVRMMNSTAALNLAAWLGVKGRCYSVSSACATGIDSIGHGFELIRHGTLDRCITGGAEGAGVRNFWAFEAAGGASPTDADVETACRPFDRDRHGMVPSEGAGILLLESMEEAEWRGAPIVAEVIGYGSANDGEGMYKPTGAGLTRAIEQALEVAATHGPVTLDYINPHGAGTRVGDPVEVSVIRRIFGNPSPLVSSTKPLNGHSQGAAGAHEAIFTLLMLVHDFVIPTPNLEHVAPECEGVRHVRAPLAQPLRTVMTSNSGLGGSNACLIFRKP